MNGRKRHIVVDTLGLLLTVLVHSADIQDYHAAPAVLWRLKGRFPRLQLIWADAGYGGTLAAWLRRMCHWTLEIVRRREGVGALKFCRTGGWWNEHWRGWAVIGV